MPLLLLFAPGAADAQIITGSYMGNGVAGRAITGLDFPPDAVIIKGDTAQSGVMRTQMAATKGMIVTGPVGPNMIQSLDANGPVPTSWSGSIPVTSPWAISRRSPSPASPSPPST